MHVDEALIPVVLRRRGELVPERHRCARIEARARRYVAADHVGFGFVGVAVVHFDELRADAERKHAQIGEPEELRHAAGLDLRRLLFTEVGDPDKDAAYLEKISPVFHAENIRRPLLVLQGANDPRVLPIESRDIVAKVKANNVPVEYVEFPGEGHGFRKKANQIVAYTRVLEFLDKYVRGTPSEATAAQGVAPTTGHDKISPLGDFPLGK